VLLRAYSGGRAAGMLAPFGCPFIVREPDELREPQRVGASRVYDASAHVIWQSGARFGGRLAEPFDEVDLEEALSEVAEYASSIDL
jgi:hypothetical protein